MTPIIYSDFSFEEHLNISYLKIQNSLQKANYYDRKPIKQQPSAIPTVGVAKR